MTGPGTDLPVVVVKFGGAALRGGVQLDRFAAGVAALAPTARVVVVHGGGPQISALLARLGLPSEFRAGLRVSSPEVVSAARLALLGEVAPVIVQALRQQGVIACGLSGADAGILTARLAHIEVAGSVVDLGHVGEVSHVNSEALTRLLDIGWVPVIASVAPDAEGTWLNVNADAVASAVAGALSARRLHFLTDVPGIHRSWPSEEPPLSEADGPLLRELLTHAGEGMRPKIDAVLTALDAGVGEVVVGDDLDSPGTRCRR